MHILQKRSSQLCDHHLNALMTISLQGEIHLENIPVKDVAVTFFAPPLNGQGILAFGATTTASNGCFSLSFPISKTYAWQDIGIRICSYLIFPNTRCAFPLFLGIESLVFNPRQSHYHLGIIPICLQWSFCERPLIFRGHVFKNNPGDIDIEERIVKLRTLEGYTINETTTDLDGNYHLPAYGDNLLKDYSDVLIEVIHRGSILKTIRLPLGPKEHIYEVDMKIS